MPVWVAAVLAGLIAGSFAGVLIRRVPAGRPVLRARSACETCHAVLRPRELVPLVSYLVQRGRCARCGAAIGAFHPAVELAGAGVAGWAALVTDDAATLAALCLLGWTLLTLAWIDARTLRLPDVLTLPLLLAGLAEAGWLEPEALGERAFAAAAGYGIFRLVALSYRAWRGRDGLGMGDAKLLAASGAWVGLAGLPWVVLLGAGLAIFFTLGDQLRRRTWDPAALIPFGSFLAAATWLVALHGVAVGAVTD